MASLLQLAFVGVVSGLFSAMLAHLAHQQKRWWDLRVTAYQELIYTLSDLSFYYGEHYDACLYRRGMSDEYAKKLNSVWDDGYPKVRRAADAGAFLFSSEVAAALQAFRSTTKADHHDSFDHFESHFSAVEKCLRKVVEASKSDLKLGWWLR